MADADMSWMDAIPGAAGAPPPASGAGADWMQAIPDAAPASSNDYPVARGQMTGWSPNLGAGLKEGVIGTLSQAAGAPSDLVTRVPNMALHAMGLPQVPSTGEAVKGALSWIGGSPENVVPGSQGQAVGRAGMRMLGGTAVLGGAGMPGILEAPLTSTAAALASGGAGELARQAAPEKYKDAAEFAAQMGTGALVGGATALGKGISDRVTPMVKDYIAPLGRAGQERLAAERVGGAATDLPAAREALATPSEIVPGSAPTSFQVTGDPGLGTIERGMRNDQRYAADFQQRRVDQNAAQTSAIEQQRALVDASNIGPWFRRQLADLHARGEQDVVNERAVTQGAVESMGAPTTAQQAGGIVRGAVEQARAPDVSAAEQAVARAQTGAEGALSEIGGVGGSEQSRGVAMRGAPSAGEVPGTGLVWAREPVKAATGRLYDAVNPDGTAALDVTGVRDAARNISGEINTRMGGKPADAEARVLDAAKSLRPVELLSDLQELRTNTTTALREIKTDPKLGAASRPYRRMTMMLEAIDNQMSSAVEQQAQREESAIQSGTMRPEDGIVGRLQEAAANGEGQGGAGAGGTVAGGAAARPAGADVAEGGATDQGVAGGQRGAGPSGTGAVAPAAPTRRAESLRDFLIRSGGIKDQGGELSANDLNLLHHRRGGRLVNNSSGMNLDAARELAIENGYPLRSNDINGLLDAVTQHEPVYRVGEGADEAVRVQTQREAARTAADQFTYGANIDEIAAGLGQKLSPAEHEHATALHMLGAHPEDAIRQAARVTEESVLQRNAEHNVVGSPGVPLGAQQGEMGVERGQLEPNFSAKDRDALRAANAAYREYVQRFRTGAIGDVLATDARTINGYRVPDSAVPSRIFASGPKGAEAADSLIRATGSKEAALSVLGDYPAFSLRAKAEDMGVLVPKKYEAWVKDHQAILDKFPEIKAKFDTVAAARATLDEAKAQRTALEKANPIQPGWGDADVIRQFVVPGPRGAESAAALVRATKGSPTAMEATKDFLASSLRNAAEVKSGPNAGTLDLPAHARWMRQYESFLSHPEMADLRARFQSAADAQSTLDAANSAHVAARKALENGVTRHFLGQDVDPATAMGGILESRTARPQMADLARLTRNDPLARQSLQSAAIDYFLRRVRSNRAVGADTGETFLKAEQLQNMIRAHVGDEGAGALRMILDPPQIEALQSVARDIQRANLSNQHPSGSPTALNTSALHGGDHRPSTAGALATMESLGEGAGHLFGGFGRVLGMISVPIIGAARRNGFNHVDDLVAAAALHPERMRALFDKLPTERQVPSRITALKGQIAALAVASQGGRDVSQ